MRNEAAAALFAWTGFEGDSICFTDNAASDGSTFAASAQKADDAERRVPFRVSKLSCRAIVQQDLQYMRCLPR